MKICPFSQYPSILCFRPGLWHCFYALGPPLQTWEPATLIIQALGLYTVAWCLIENCVNSTVQQCRNSNPGLCAKAVLLNHTQSHGYSGVFPDVYIVNPRVNLVPLLFYHLILVSLNRDQRICLMVTLALLLVFVFRNSWFLLGIHIIFMTRWSFSLNIWSNQLVL